MTPLHTRAPEHPNTPWSASLALSALLFLLISAPFACTSPPTPSEPNPQDAGATDTKKPFTFTAMTFNVGTTTGLAHDKNEGTPQGDGYTSAHAKITDEHYENSLSWNPAERALTAFLAKKKPDIAGFQELYYDPWCETIQVDPSLDFVCKEYSKSRPLQIQRILGPDYQVACAVGQDDNCVGIHKRLGQFKGCPLDKPCLGGLFGMSPPDKCSRGARVGSIEVQTHNGPNFVLVLVHGTSGVKEKDTLCRKAQFHQIFVDRGDGKPAAYGKINLVLGDLNTDPFLMKDADVSAAYWNQFVGPGKPYTYISSNAPDGPRTYAGTFRIDHVVSDAFRGQCTVPGITPQTEPVFSGVYWDHSPILCSLTLPQ